MPNPILERQVLERQQSVIDSGRARYSRWIESAKDADRNMSMHMEANIIQALHNVENQMYKHGWRPDDINKIFNKIVKEDVTKPSDIDSFINYGFDMITAALPGTVIEEYASIQTIDKRVGEIFYMDIVQGSNKGSYNKGDPYLSSLTGPQTGMDYSNERIDIEEIYDGDGSTLIFSGAILGYGPITTGTNPSSVNLNPVLRYIIGSTLFETQGVVVGSNVTFTDAVNISSATLNLTTRQLDVTFLATKAPDNNTKVSVTYYFTGSTDAVVQIPEVYLRLTSKFVTAVRRFMNTRWMIDTVFMLQKEHGRDMEKELTEKTLSGVMNEIAIEVAYKILKGATANGGLYSDFDKTSPAPGTIPYVVHRQEVLGHISTMAVDIEDGTRDMTANFVIAGKDLINVIRGLPRDMYEPVKYPDKVPTGIHVVGLLDNQYKVIQNFDYPADEFIVGAKGPDWLTTGCVYAPFIPLMTTPINWNLNGDQWRSILSWYAVELVNSGYYSKGRVIAT